MYTRSIPRRTDPDGPMDRLLHSASTNRSETAFVNNLTDPPPGWSQTESKFAASLAGPTRRHILARSDSRDVERYPDPGQFRVALSQKNVSRVGIQTCVLTGSSPPPAFILLHVEELGNFIEDASGRSEFACNFPLIVKSNGNNSYVADNQLYQYYVDLRQPINLKYLTLTFKDGLTAERISGQTWSFNVVIEIQSSPPDAV